MTDRAVLGWVRDRKGNIISRPIHTDCCNALTTFCGGGRSNAKEGYGMGNTTPYVIEIWKLS